MPARNENPGLIVREAHAALLLVFVLLFLTLLLPSHLPGCFLIQSESFVDQRKPDLPPADRRLRRPRLRHGLLRDGLRRDRLLRDGLRRDRLRRDGLRRNDLRRNDLRRNDLRRDRLRRLALRRRGRPGLLLCLEFKPVDTTKSLDVSCSAKCTCSKKFSLVMSLLLYNRSLVQCAGLFCSVIGLFCSIIGLFCSIIGLIGHV